MTLWLNGAFVDPNKAHIAPHDRGFLLGDGLFETMLSRNSVIVGFSAHMARIRASAEVLELPIPYDDFQIADVAQQLISAHALEGGYASLRLTVSRGSGPRGLRLPKTSKPTCMMTVAPVTTVPQQMTAVISEVRRNDLSPLSNLKTLNYLDNILARREAESAGADEAIMLNTKDRVACASSANVFMIERDQLVTPPLEDGVLPGITRAIIMRLADEQKITCAEETISLDQLMTADAVFLTNSLMGVCPISRLETKTFRMHAETVRLQTLYDDFLNRPTN